MKNNTANLAKFGIVMSHATKQIRMDKSFFCQKTLEESMEWL